MLRLAVAISLANIGCVVPYALPPLKAEAGGATVTGERPMFHAAGGAHLASAVLDKEQTFDVGAGGFVDVDEDGPNTTGAYVDGAMFVEKSATTRTSLGLRGELRSNPDGLGVGAKLRVEHELFGTTNRGYSGSDRCAVIGGHARGTGGIGMFAEAGRVWMPDQKQAWTATAGVTLRVPSTIGVFAGIPGCK